MDFYQYLNNAKMEEEMYLPYYDRKRNLIEKKENPFFLFCPGIINHFQDAKVERRNLQKILILKGPK